jgi:hypothetical protein
MKRRNFLKSVLAGTVAASLPGCRLPAGPNESAASFVPISEYGDTAPLRNGEIGRVVGYDIAKPGSEKTVWGVRSSGGGYICSDEITEALCMNLSEVRKIQQAFPS